MTREYEAFFASSMAAERTGDAETALEYHRGIPMFTRSAHVVLLTQLAGLSEEMTPWLWARWAAYQCTRVEDPGTDSRAIAHAALDYTLRMFYPDVLADAYAAGTDPMPEVARIVGEDWALHQVCTFELGGLGLYLDDLVSGRLARESELARTWLDARMGGYRIEQSGEPGLVVRDLAQDRQLELLDLGARVHANDDGWLIGRVVPSGTTPGLMFDTRPLAVDQQTAREVAAGSARGAWIAPLERGIADGRVDRSVLQSEDRELVTDVPSLALVERGTPTAALAHTMDQLRQGRDEVGRAALRILRSVAEGSIASDLAPYVAAAALNAHAYPEAEQRIVGPGQRELWEGWAALVPDPARGRLRRLAELSSSQAA